MEILNVDLICFSLIIQDCHTNIITLSNAGDQVRLTQKTQMLEQHQPFMLWPHLLDLVTPF